jgi:hypothetical protein
MTALAHRLVALTCWAVAGVALTWAVWLLVVR